MTLRRQPAWANTKPAGGLVADAYVRFSSEGLGDLLRSTEFTIVVNNLFDKAYLSAITETTAWLGVPRTISMTATVSF